MPLSVHEITMAAPNVICVEVLDGEIDYGIMFQPAVAQPGNMYIPYPFSVPTFRAVDANSGGRKWQAINEAGTWGRSEDLAPDAYLDRDAALVPGDYVLTGTARTVEAVYLRSLPNKWGKGATHDVDAPDGVSWWIRRLQMQHLLYLELDDDLASPSTVTINFPAGVDLANEEFIFNDKITRARSIKTTQVGHRPNDEAKIGSLALWLPGAPDEGAVDFSTYGLVGDNKFHLINANGAISFTGDITLKAGATEAEVHPTIPGFDASGNHLGGTYAFASGVAGMVRYASLNEPEREITSVTIATPGVATSTAHGFVNDEIIVLRDDGGFAGFLHNNIIQCKNVTANTFELYAYNGTTYVALNCTGRTWASGNKVYAFKTHLSNRAGTNVYELDYSAANVSQGAYRVYIPGLGVSDRFVIEEGNYFSQIEAGAAGEYHQRLGIPLDGRYGYTCPTRFRPGTGGITVYKSKVSYNLSSYWYGTIPVQKAHIAPWSTATTQPDAWGAWQDASDFDSRLFIHATGCATLLDVYDMIKVEGSGQFDVNLPKSSELLDPTIYAGTDGLSDMLHSAIFFMDSYRRMQTPAGQPEAGGCAGGVTYGYGDPGANDQSMADQPSWLADVTGIATYLPDHPVTYVYAALAAQLAKTLDGETGLASEDRTRLVDLYTESAELAWTWAENLYLNSGARESYYGFMKGAGFDMTTETFNSEMARLQDFNLAGQNRMWAAAALFRLTGDTAYKTIFDTGWGVSGWDTYAHAAYAAWQYSIAAGADDDIKTACEDKLYGKCEIYLNVTASKIPYATTRYPIYGETFGRGGGLKDDTAQLLPMGHQIAKARGLPREDEFLPALQGVRTYLTGCNQMGISFTVGLGTRGPGNILHGDSHFKGGEFQSNLPKGATVYGSTTNLGFLMFQYNYDGTSFQSMPNDAATGRQDPAILTYDTQHKFVSPNCRPAIPTLEQYMNTPNFLEQMEYVVTQSIVPVYTISAYLHGHDGNTERPKMRKLLNWAS